MEKQTKAITRQLTHPLKSRIFLLSKLPSAFFTGVRIRDVDEKKCRVTVPYNWFSKNPFHSIYFACLGMAAEMSTGVLCMIHLYYRKPPVSMLVVKVEGDYFKKATDKTIFICEDGEKIENAIDEAILSGEARTIRAKSTGTNKNGELVATFYITWSFKVKSKK